MARFSYNSDTPVGQMVAEGINDLLTGFFKIKRSYESVALMDVQQMTIELGVEEQQQTLFKNDLDQLCRLLDNETVSTLSKFDQG